MDSIEAFAWLCAMLDTDLVERDDVLTAVGLGDATWNALCDDLLPVLAARDAPDVSLRFAAAYAAARQRRARELCLVAQPEFTKVRAALGLDGEDTEESAAPPEVLGADCTTELVLAPVGPVLPFHAGTMLPPEGATPSGPPAAANRETQERTIELPHTLPPGPTLPFAAVPDAPRQRLVRFDTQTGAPLKEPYWVEDVTDVIH